jgi:hypothetical protein
MALTSALFSPIDELQSSAFANSMEAARNP